MQRNSPALLSRLIDCNSPFRMILLIALWLTAFAGVRMLVLPDEGRYVGVAWEMVTRGDWSVPILDGLPFFHKPPLFYWITALGLKLFGVNDWAARIAPVLAGILTAGGLYLFARQYRDSRVATVSTVVLLTQPFFFGGAQYANLDMLVAGMISLTILSGADAVFRIEQNRPYRAALARTYALAALGVLAKGLIGFVLPGGVLFFWLLWRRAWRPMLKTLWLPGVGLFLAIALPWFVWMQQRYPGFYDYFVVYHHFRRFAETGFNNQHPVWFYIPVLLLLALPWTIGLKRVANRAYWQDKTQAPLRSLMAIWLLVIVGFFSLPSSKLIGYVLPALAPLAYLIGEPLAQWLDSEPQRAIRRYAISLAIAVTTCVAIVSVVALQYDVTAKPLALVAKKDYTPDDDLAMIDWYQYDLPLYLRATKPAWAVSNWSDPAIPKFDDWRKELLDASEFDKETSATVLLEETPFTMKLCASQRTVWVWARPPSMGFALWLKELPVYAANARYSLWRFTPEIIKTLPICAGKPTGG